MASVEFKNNAQSTIADNPLTAGATTLNIATGEGTKFPSAFPFKITLWDASMYPNPGNDPGMEIVKCTARTIDALTIVRAQEGTSGVEHSNGERVAMLITAGHFNDAVTGIITKLDTVETNAKDDQIASEVLNTPAGDIVATDVQAAITELDIEKVAKAGDTMTGDLNQDGNYLLNSASVNALNAKGERVWCDGIDDYIHITDSSSLDITKELTLHIKLKWLGIAGSRAGIFNKVDSDAISAYGLYAHSSVPRFTAKIGGSVKYVNFDALVDGDILDIIATYNGSNMIVCLNGIENANKAVSGDISTNNYCVRISSQEKVSFSKLGAEIYIAHIYNRALSALEAKALSSGAPIEFADIGADDLELWDTAASVFTAQDVTINNVGGYATGVNSMTVDALPFTLKVGTKLTFAGGGEYIITTEAAASATTILSTSGLTGFAVVDGEAAPSGTYAWIHFGNNLIANVSNALEITHVDSEFSAYVQLRDSSDLSSNLIVGKRYRLTLTLSYAGGASAPEWKFDDGTPVIIWYETLTTTPTTYTLEFIARSATIAGIGFNDMVSGNVITVDNLSLKRIGCVLQLEQDGIGHNQWLDKSGNENHGAVSGAIPINLECNHIERYEQTVAMTDDTAWTNKVPAGYELEKIIFVESAGNAATLDLGKTSGASDVFSQEVIAASIPTTVIINKTFSMSAAQSLYLNDDGVGTWNSASVKATLFMRRVEL